MRNAASLTFAVAVVSTFAGGMLFVPDRAHTEELAKTQTGGGTTTCGECVSDGFLSGMKDCKTVYPDGTVVITTYSCTLPKKDDGDTLPLAPPVSPEPTRPPSAPGDPSGGSVVK